MMTNPWAIRQWALAIVLGMMLAPAPARLEAQTSPSPAPASPSVARSLLDKAHALELGGRIDLAELTSQNNPNLAQVESTTPLKQDRQSQLQQAARLAEAGNYAAAMIVYRRVFGANPPSGDWAIAYYETEAATEDGRPHAVAGLRALLDHDPANPQYRIALGRALTCDPATREEGREYLASFPKDPKAADAFRQSLLWDVADPVVQPQIRAYLATHPDPQLAAALMSGHPPATGPTPPAPAPVHTPSSTATTLAPSTSSLPPTPPTVATAKAPPSPAPAPTPTRTPAAASAASTLADDPARTRAAEMAAYQALNSNHVDEAESDFKAILAAAPQNPAALAGIGYVRMQQGNFAGAVGFLEQAKQLRPDDKGLASALDTARFWFIMGEGQHALNDNDLTTAEKRYRGALDLRPNSADALAGLGSTLTRAQQPAAAIPFFQRALAADPASTLGWRGLFIAQVQSGNAALALATDKQVPAAVHTQLMSDPLFLASLAAAYSATGQPGDAQRTLETAPGRSREAAPYLNRVEQDYVAESKAPPADVEIQTAWALYNGMEDAGLYRQLVNLGNRTDLTPDQRNTVQTIWTNWAVRRANQATAAGNPRRALAILNATAQAFPGNPATTEALAAGYTQAGQPHQAVLIYRAQDLSSASAADYQAAVSAALADGDSKDAEVWLRYALKAYPSDPQILMLGARFEQARGHTARAIDYYHASLKAMPPGAKPPTEPGPPAATTPPGPPNPNLPQDLVILLAPDTDDQPAPAPVPIAPREPYPSTGNSPVSPYGGTSKVVPPAQSSADVSGPYIAYIPATPASSPVTGPDRGVTGRVVLPVQLGDKTPPPVQQQTDMTDVLPTQRYAPSARANEAARAGPEAAAARAARIRQLQQDAAARTGQSQPSNDDIVAAATPMPAPVSTPIATGPTPVPPQLAPPVATAPAPNPAPIYPPLAPTYQLAPPTDAELQARNLPALGSFYARQAPIPLSPRRQAESELASLEGSYSGWLGVTGIGRYRAGTVGLDRLNDIEAPSEASAVIARTARITAVALPVFLNSGQLNTSSFTSNYVPYLGTLPANAAIAPAQQYSYGMGGELQLTTKDLGLAAGYTPYNFLVHNLTARLHFSTIRGHLSLFGTRDPVKDTQLSYAGLRDPGAAYPGPIWGGVIATTGGIRLSLGSSRANFYLSGSGGELTGRHVLSNTVFQSTTGADFRVGNWPSGALTLGYTLAGMHYQHNEAGLSYGQGGYFSPGSYFLAAVPVTFNGRYKTNFHYAIAGGLGVQTFAQEEAPFYPLDPALQSAFKPSNGIPCTAAQAPSYNCGQYPRQDSTLFNYSINAEAAYRFAGHWYGGGYLSANNTSKYSTVSAGFFFRYVFSSQHSDEGFPTGLFHLQGLRPLQIP